MKFELFIAGLLLVVFFSGFVRAQQCTSSCSEGDAVCHAYCNGTNGCSGFIAACDGKAAGSMVCTDASGNPGTSYATTCCNGYPGGLIQCALPMTTACCPDLGCKNLNSDSNNCGYCRFKCPLSAESCCSGLCSNPSNDPNNCGSCGNVCPTGTCCSATCVDLDSNASHCGSCGNSCGSLNPICQNGNCVQCISNSNCPSGQTCQSGNCVSTTACTCSDGQACGTCYSTQPWYCDASGNKIQNPGVCGCPNGRTNCNGVCVNETSDSYNCGGCGIDCTDGTPYCVSGKCVQCQFEVDCPTGQTCQSGSCVPLGTPSTCNSNCTFGSGSTCNSSCCSLTAGCAGNSPGAWVCTDPYSHAQCCSGSSTSCGISTSPCPAAFCNGTTQSCKYTSCAYGGSAVCLNNCSNGACSTCTPTLTATCTDCSSGQICDNGACVTKTGCSSDTECSTGQHCCGNICTSPACTGLDDGNPCTADSCDTSDPCNPKSVHTPLSSGSCLGGTCQNGACIATGSCSSNPDCSDGMVCCGNICTTPACTSDSDCNDGNSCTVDTCQNPGACNAACTHTARSCPTGETCQSGICVSTATAGCQSDSNCSGQKCCSGTCKTPLCTSDSDCNDGNSCTVDTCQNPGACNAACTHTAMSSCCGDGKCGSGEGCSTCPADCPCSYGQTCTNNRCTSKQLLQNGNSCTKNDDCVSNYCNKGYCCAAGICCSTDSECSAGYICKSYTCQDPAKKCADGTSGGQCSADKPKFCNNGNDVFACPSCGCPAGSVCRMDGFCVRMECSDGTDFGECSSNKPQFCSDGALITNCSKCGCDEGYICDLKSSMCYGVPVITIISPLENSTVNLSEGGKVVIRGVVSKGRGMSYNIEGNDSRFMLTDYNALTGEFSFESISPITKEYNSVKVRLADSKGNVLTTSTRDFRVVYAPSGSSPLQGIPWLLVQIMLLLIFLALLLNFIVPVVRSMWRGVVYFSPDSIVLVEGKVGSGKEEFCLNMLHDILGTDNFVAVLSHDPIKEERAFKEGEKNRMIFIKIEPDVNEISWSISKALSAKPKGIFFNIMDLLMPKYNAEELTDFLNTNFKKLRDAKCGAVFCVDKGVDEKNLSAIEGLFDGVVEFQVKEEKGKLSSSYRVRGFRAGGVDTNWRRFK